MSGYMCFLALQTFFSTHLRLLPPATPTALLLLSLCQYLRPILLRDKKPYPLGLGTGTLLLISCA